MKLLAKIEDFINHILIKIDQLLAKLVPSKWRQWAEKVKKKRDEKRAKLKQHLSVKTSKLVEVILFLPSKLKAVLVLLTSWMMLLSNKLKEKGVVKNLSASFLLPLITPIKRGATSLINRLEKVRPQTVALTVSLCALLFLASLVIVGNTKKIIESSAEQIEEVESAPQNLRKDYYQQDDRQLLVSEITIPIYVGKGNAPRTLILDVTLKTSNRYLKSYFYENDYLLKDRLNRTIEPVIPTLPLEDEGKRIIREKIINELNQLIKERKIKGHIEDVYFHNIING